MAPPPPPYDPYGGYPVPPVPMPAPAPVPAPSTYVPIQVTCLSLLHFVCGWLLLFVAHCILIFI